MAGVATAKDNMATGSGCNCCEADKNVPVYVETEVTDIVRCIPGGRCSLGRISHAIPEFRFTRVGVTTNVCTDWAATGILDFKVGRRGLAINSPLTLPNY